MDHRDSSRLQLSVISQLTQVIQRKQENATFCTYTVRTTGTSDERWWWELQGPKCYPDTRAIEEVSQMGTGDLGTICLTMVAENSKQLKSKNGPWKWSCSCTAQARTLQRKSHLQGKAQARKSKGSTWTTDFRKWNDVLKIVKDNVDLNKQRTQYLSKC